MGIPVQFYRNSIGIIWESIGIYSVGTLGLFYENFMGFQLEFYEKSIGIKFYGNSTRILYEFRETYIWIPGTLYWHSREFNASSIHMEILLEFYIGIQSDSHSEGIILEF